MINEKVSLILTKKSRLTYGCQDGTYKNVIEKLNGKNKR